MASQVVHAWFLAFILLHLHSVHSCESDRGWYLLDFKTHASAACISVYVLIWKAVWKNCVRIYMFTHVHTYARRSLPLCLCCMSRLRTPGELRVLFGSAVLNDRGKAVPLWVYLSFIYIHPPQAPVFVVIGKHTGNLYGPEKCSVLWKELTEKGSLKQ